ncbi:MAG: hypothetical protein U1G05_19655 [Kiritimatiellia bacterium]
MKSRVQPVSRGVDGRAKARLSAATTLLLMAATAGAQTTRTWAGADGNMATAANWSPSGVPSVASGDHIVFDGSSAQTALTFLQGTFNNNPGLGNITLAATQTDALSMDNAGTAGAVLRLNSNSSLAIAAGAGTFSLGTGGNTFFLNLYNGGAGNTFTNNSANPAVIGTSVSINASSGVNGLAIFDGSGDWNVTGLITSAVTTQVIKNGGGT